MDEKLSADIVDKIRSHAQMGAEELTLDTPLTELGIHSLELAEIIFDIEDAYGVEIDMNTSEAWDNLSDVRDIVEAVETLIRQKT